VNAVPRGDRRPVSFRATAIIFQSLPAAKPSSTKVRTRCFASSAGSTAGRASPSGTRRRSWRMISESRRESQGPVVTPAAFSSSAMHASP